MRIARWNALALAVATAGLTMACAKGSTATVDAPRPAEPKAAPAAPAFEVKPTDSRYGAFLGVDRIGTMRLVIQPAEHEGRPALEVTADEDTTLKILGQTMVNKVQMRTVCGLDLRPLEQTVTMNSGGRDSKVHAVFHADRVAVTRTAGGNETKQDVPIPAGAKLVGDVRAVLADGKLDVGDTAELYEFNPVTLTVDRNSITALRAEELELDGVKHQAVVTETKSPMVTVTSWVDADGGMLQMQATLMGATLTYRLESQETPAPAADENANIELVAATAIRPDKPIANSMGTTRLRLRVLGLDNLQRVPDDAFIDTEKAGDGWWTVTIAAIKPGDGPGAELPITDPALADYLKPAAYIESDHEKMKATVREIFGGQEPTHATTAARTIRDWVDRRLKRQANIGLLRSALEVLEDPAGVCRDAAALYTGLARAAGVPTKVCAGLVYMNGVFAGHAWAESWDGERWVPYDPMFPGGFVDATHLKLAEGAAYTCMFDMMPATSGMKIEVVEATTD